MTIKRPSIALSRSGTDLTVTLINFEAGDTWNIYLGKGHIANPSKIVSDHDQSSYTIPNINLEINPTIRVSLNNAPITASVTVVEDHSDEDPGYYVVEAKPGITITPNLQTIAIPWGDDLVDLQFYQVDNPVIENAPTGPQTSIGKNQTL